MQNAKEELLRHLKDNNKELTDIIAFNFGILNKNDHYNIDNIISGEIFTSEHLDILNFNYDSGYGSQELYGIVLFNDKTWLSREEYDGSEWWIYNITPSIEEVIKKDFN